MKAISTRQPWAHLIVRGIKRIENRSWSTDYRGPLLIHAAVNIWADASFGEIELRYRVRLPSQLPLGALVGRVELLDVVTRSRDRFFSGPYGFVLGDAREIVPVAMVGRSRLFDVPDELLAVDQ